MVAASFFVGDVLMELGLQIAGGVLATTGAFVGVLRLLRTKRRAVLVETVKRLIEHENAAGFVTDFEGKILSQNLSAQGRFRDQSHDTLSFCLSDLFANPGAVLFRLQSKAQAVGAAREDLVTRRGHVRLSVQDAGESIFVWRLDDVVEKMGAGRGADALGLPMLTAGPSGTILYMNEASRRLVGGRAKSLDRVFAEQPLVSGQLHQVKGVDGLVDCLVAELRGNGGRREIYLLPGEASTQMRGVAAAWDAVEDLPVPLLKIAVTGEVVGSNREARQLLNNQIPNGTRLADLMDGLGRPIVDWLREAAEGRVAPSPEFLRSTGDRQDTFVQVMLNPLEGEESCNHVIAVLNDVTELKSLEAQFVQSQKMQAIGQLAGGVAHDFNNLLTAISGHCDLLLLRHDQGDQDYGDLIQIHQNANRAASLVGQLLAFSRKQNLRPELLDLRNTLSDLTHLLNRLVGEKVTLTLNHDPGLLNIRADKRQLEQVMMNLVVNARDAMATGGEIRVETENSTLKQPLERDRATVPPGDYVIVRVVDEGCGIPPEKLPKIFEPFYTTKRTGEGTGLGLSTAYGIVKQTGGFIFADSSVGTGSVFTIFLPAYDMPVPVENTNDRPEDRGRLAVQKGDGVVLLVEDEAPVRAFASRALRLRGYTVLEAESAEAALDMLADPELSVDIFVTDVIMPGMDGPTWVKKALVTRPDTKVVFVSGYAEDAFGDDQAGVPNSVFLPKPFSLTDLTSTVQEQLH
ncbi:ATP-binding protein [Aestuariibius sp. HNIBRBA575]|uniref:hybrid sensor histidine kinase/response regulator n=1 Tax=Aestuariibius sp. HNIBRBA575 TaxID=3233343 RepID=UPI0034A51CC0